MDPTGGTSPHTFRSVHQTERLGPSWVRASSPTWRWQSRELWKPRFCGRPFGRAPRLMATKRAPKFSNEWSSYFRVPKLVMNHGKKKSGSIENHMFFCLAKFWTHADSYLISTKKKKCVLQIRTLTCLRVFGVFSGLQFAFLLTRTSSLLASTGSPSSKFFDVDASSTRSLVT